MAGNIVKKVYLGSDTSGIDISDKITYLRFAQSIKQDDSVTLFSEGNDARALLEMAELKEGKNIVFSFGYLNGPMSPLYKALITDLNPRYAAEDFLVLTIKCGDRGRTMRKVRTKKVWKRKSTDQIIKEIAYEHGCNTYIEVPAGGFIKWASLPQGDMTNMEFLQMLAGREKDGNYICFIHGDDLHFVTRNVDTESTDNIVVGKYDKLMEFDIKYEETTAPGAANEIGAGVNKINMNTAKDNMILGETGVYTASGAVYFKDKKGKKSLLITEEGRVTGEGQKVFANDAGLLKFQEKVLKPAIKTVNTEPQKVTRVGMMSTDTYVPVPTNTGFMQDDIAAKLATNGPSMLAPEVQDETETVNHATSIHKAATLRILTADMKEYGNPLRKIHAVITVSGVATRYVGNWMVEVVSHDVGPTQYVTTSKVSKNGLKKGGLAHSGESNTKEAAKEEMVSIGLQGKDNGKVFQKEKVTGKRKEIRFTPYRPGNDPGLGKEQ